jgi:hypothetical protein
MMRKLKLKLARLFYAESVARCRARIKRENKLIYEAGSIYGILQDGEYGYMRNYL